jgi:hypothetical protein
MAIPKGYDGGDNEEQLVTAIAALLDAEEADTVANIKNKYWVIGSAIEIAIARGYTTGPGLKGWFFNKFRKGETHCKECLTCWQDRTTFDNAYDWWKTGNTAFMPSKLSGPRFSKEICAAYRDRLKSDADKLARRNRGKNLSAKQLREQAALWRARYDRLKGEHLLWSKQDQREPRELIAIELEIAAEETGEAPIHAKRPTSPNTDTEGGTDDTSTENGEDEVTQTEREQEHHPGDGAAEYPSATDATEEQHPGAPADNRRDLYVVPTPDQPTQSTAVATIDLLKDISVSVEDIAAITKDRGLRQWAGVTGDDDDLLYRKRAAYYVLSLSVSAEDDAVLGKLGKAFWREVITKANVDQRIPIERSKQAAATPRKRTKAKQQDAAE